MYKEISDDLPKNPTTGYGIAKLDACRMGRLLCEQYGMRHNWGRIVSTYGPKDNPYTMVMSSIIHMLNGERMSLLKAIKYGIIFLVMTVLELSI